MPGAFNASPVRWCDDADSDAIAEVRLGFARPEEAPRERGVRYVAHASSATAKRLLLGVLRRDPSLRLDLAERIIWRAQLHALARWAAQWPAC